MSFEIYLTDTNAVADLNSKRIFLDRLLLAYKAKNQTENVNVFQYFWMQQKCTNWIVNVPNAPQYGPYAGQSFTFNLMNVYPTGDIEAAYYALLWGVPDDMTQPWHWMSQDRLTWLANEVKEWLGWP